MRVFGILLYFSKQSEITLVSRATSRVRGLSASGEYSPSSYSWIISGLSSGTIELDVLCKFLRRLSTDSAEPEMTEAWVCPADIIDGEIVLGIDSNEDWEGCFVFASFVYWILPAGIF